MKNKCPVCGYEYNEGDMFCAKCGRKLSLKSDVINEIKKFDNSSKKATKNKPIFNSEFKSFSNNFVVCACIILLMMALAVSVLMFFILTKHDSEREVLQFKNLISNPSQIPLLREPKNYKDLKTNLFSVEEFLLLYLQQTDDSQEKKDQVFSAYLEELNKLPNILNERFVAQNIEECSNLSSANSCVAALNKEFLNTSVKAYSYGGKIYLYPDLAFIKSKYGEFLSNDFKKYVSLRAKYNYPVSFGLELNIEPKKLGNKIYDFEKLYSQIDNAYLKNDVERILYNDFRKYIFTPSIYSTVTQEMKKEFENAYLHFIRTKKESVFRPVVMSYLDKKRAYDEENFKNDYPLKKYDGNKFDENIKNSVFEDVFVQLRKNIFADKNTSLNLSYVYSIKNGQWKKYSKDIELSQGEYVLSDPDDNNNVSIYNHMFSPMQELNILKYSKLYLINNMLYAYNKDKLSISKITFNGKTFNRYNLAYNDITSIFPGIEIINIDTFQSYNVLIEKDNEKAAYIILSRYSQGWNDYNLEALKGNINILTLPNMFSVDSLKDVVVSFHGTEKPTEEFYENTPSYKFTIRTRGEEVKQEDSPVYAQYDKKTEKEQNTGSEHKPNIMPKLLDKNDTIEIETIDLLTPPAQEIEPPKDEDNE